MINIITVNIIIVIIKTAAYRE